VAIVVDIGAPWMRICMQSKVDEFLYEFWYYQMGYLSDKDIEQSIVAKFGNAQLDDKKQQALIKKHGNKIKRPT
jgi:hypothetical protein